MLSAGHISLRWLYIYRKFGQGHTLHGAGFAFEVRTVRDCMDDHKLKMERRSTHGKGVSNRQFGHWPGNRTDENERSDYQCMSQLSSPHCRSSTSMNGFDGRSEPIVTLERVTWRGEIYGRSLTPRTLLPLFNCFRGPRRNE